MWRPVMSISRLTRKLSYAALLVRRGGAGALFKQFASRISSTSRYIWLAKEVGPPEPLVSSKVEFSLKPASSEDFQALLGRLGEEKGRDIFEILRRASFFRRGFDGCYFATTAAGDVCHLGWLLTARHNGLIRSEYPAGTDPLGDEEALVENIMTPPRYRGQGIMLSVLHQMEDLARAQGLRRMVAYVEITNTASMSGFNRAGYRPYAEEREVRRFFRIKRTGRIGRQAR
jgi:RimJ/RimL family protein N-acetyltransferase